MDHLLGAYGDIDIEDEEDETEAMTLVTPDQSPQKRKKEEEGRTAAASGPPTANKKHKSKGNRGGASSSSSVQLPSVIFESDGQPSSFAAPTYSAPPPMQLVEPPADYQTTPKRKYAGRGRFVPPQVRNRGRPNVPTEETVAYDEVGKRKAQSPAKVGAKAKAT